MSTDPKTVPNRMKAGKESPWPVALRQMGPRTLGIEWSDGHASIYQVRRLRLECKCALCIDEWTREKILKDDDVKEDVRPLRLDPVGRYAFRIDWSDGHSTGFYTFDHLRRLCECPQCRRHQ
jgi:ATP-binding protein involved in chromosome partitioning